MEDPIEVNSTPYHDQIMSAVRTFLIALSAWAAGKGWVPGDLSLAAIPLIMLAGQMTIRKRHAQLSAVVNAVSDEVAVFK